ncbi:MAG: hypothetical protein JNL08_16355 [Planctomycetes bacterium]|nr:hypothetical protein [Planctomycetota bacterium]
MTLPAPLAALPAPELALCVGLGAILLADLVPALVARRVAPWLGLAACAAAGVCLAVAPGDGAGMFAVDAIGRLARGLILALLALQLLAAAGDRRPARDVGVLAAALVALALGAGVTAAASHALPLWLGLELVALSSYALVACGGGDRRAAEAGMKFVLFGGVASAAMLFGLGHLYGATGSLDFASIGSGLAAASAAAVAPALLLAAAGIAYKLALVPLHGYAPDVYQGAPPLAVAAVSTLPKVAAAAALVRALQFVVPPAVAAPAALAAGLALVAATSLLFASFTALVQRCARRILAFSGIGHGAAVVLAAACAPQRAAVAAIAFYLLAYTAANTGALVCLALLERGPRGSDLAALAGSGRRRPWVAALLCLFVASLAGVPPLAGFLGKWGVLRLAFADLGAPALLAAAFAFVAATAIAAWSYLLIVRAVLFAGDSGPTDPREAAPLPVPLPTAVVLLLCAAATCGLGLWLDGFTAFAAVGP